MAHKIERDSRWNDSSQQQLEIASSTEEQCCGTLCQMNTEQIDNLNTFKRKLKIRLKEINNFQFEKDAILINNKKDIFICY